MKSFLLILNETGLLRVLSRGVCVLATQPCLTLCDLMNCSPPGSSVCEILQERMLEWAAISFSEQRGNMLQTEPLMLFADCGLLSPEQGKKSRVWEHREKGLRHLTPRLRDLLGSGNSQTSSGVQCGWRCLRNLLGECTESLVGHTKGSRFIPNTLTSQKHVL